MSLFSDTIKVLLDDSLLFTRDEWASVLGVTTNILSQWVADKMIPRSDLLWIILDALRTTNNVPNKVFDEFTKIADLPAIEISPFGHRMSPTVNEYLRRNSFDELRKLRSLTIDQQQLFLSGGWSF